MQNTENLHQYSIEQKSIAAIPDEQIVLETTFIIYIHY